MLFAVDVNLNRHRLVTALATRCQYRRVSTEMFHTNGLYQWANMTSDKACGEGIGIDLGLVQLIVKSLSILSTKMANNAADPADNKDVVAFVSVVKNLLIHTAEGSQMKLSDVAALDQVTLFHYKLML